MKRERPAVLYREMAFDRAVIDEGTRTATLSFSSEMRVVRSSWFSGQWVEILRHEATAIDLTRLNSLGVLLYQHSPFSPIGGIQSAWLDEKERKCLATVRFDVDAESDKVFQKVLSGTLRGVSVGYRVLDDDWEVVKEGKRSACGRFEGPCEIANSWTPYEASIVTIPADASVGVGRAASFGAEISEQAFDRLADAISERIMKNIPFKIEPAVVEAPLPEASEDVPEPERSESSIRLKILKRKLDLLTL